MIRSLSFLQHFLLFRMNKFTCLLATCVKTLYRLPHSIYFPSIFWNISKTSLEKNLSYQRKPHRMSSDGHLSKADSSNNWALVHSPFYTSHKHFWTTKSWKVSFLPAIAKTLPTLLFAGAKNVIVLCMHTWHEWRKCLWKASFSLSSLIQKYSFFSNFFILGILSSSAMKTITIIVWQIRTYYKNELVWTEKDILYQPEKHRTNFV